MLGNMVGGRWDENRVELAVASGVGVDLVLTLDPKTSHKKLTILALSLTR